MPEDVCKDEIGGETQGSTEYAVACRSACGGTGVFFSTGFERNHGASGSTNIYNECAIQSDEKERNVNMLKLISIPPYRP